ncbi:hypothetical protein [Curvibacter sp. AEP1-3]|uniref:hypothetical protein n=1 Tax=Curvibacter sp. AEP1-3 TaxID=1844971 RepID=UPI000B3BEB5C|nr:hypothetical protein [Curvibacter sp. AEP1-3]
MDESVEERNLNLSIEFATRCVSTDLEVGKADTKIHQIGAVRFDPKHSTYEEYFHSQGSLDAALSQLDAFSNGAEFALGQNFILFDRKHLLAARSDQSIASRPCLDTLRLNPLAFPRNPYHHLVKHYQDGQLQSGQKNNPVSDARLSM